MHLHMSVATSYSPECVSLTDEMRMGGKANDKLHNNVLHETGDSTEYYLLSIMPSTGGLLLASMRKYCTFSHNCVEAIFHW